MKMQRPDIGSTVYYVRYVWAQGYSSAQYEVQRGLYAANYAGPPFQLWIRFPGGSAVCVHESALGRQVFTAPDEAQAVADEWTRRLRESWRTL
nr:MAG TPA: hypothetical protein [Caudoviricetes sp.]